jgi:hypothetical protein
MTDDDRWTEAKGFTRSGYRAIIVSLISVNIICIGTALALTINQPPGISPEAPLIIAMLVFMTTGIFLAAMISVYTGKKNYSLLLIYSPGDVPKPQIEYRDFIEKFLSMKYIEWKQEDNAWSIKYKTEPLTIEIIIFRGEKEVNSIMFFDREGGNERICQDFRFLFDRQFHP